MEALGLIGEAWDLLRCGEGTSEVLEVWHRHVGDLLEGAGVDAQDAVDNAARHEQDHGYRVGLLLGVMLGSRRDGSPLTAPEVAQVLLDAAAWQDADAHERDYPRDVGYLDDMPVPRMTEAERADTKAFIDLYVPARRAAEVAAVGEATAAATELWQSMNGVDLVTASLEQMVELDRAQQAAMLEGRARLEKALDANPAWWP